MNKKERRKKNEEYLEFTQDYLARHGELNAQPQAAVQVQKPAPPQSNTPSVASNISNQRTVIADDEIAQKKPSAQAVKPTKTANAEVLRAASLAKEQKIIPAPKKDVTEMEHIKIENDSQNTNPTYQNMKTEIYVELSVSIGKSSVIGKRQYQQDAVIIPDDNHIELDDKSKFICVLSDGMGGLSGGERASEIVTKSIFNNYYKHYWKKEKIDYMDFFMREANIANDKVLELTDDDGNPLHAGATAVAVAVEDYDMHFLNVGDSRIYVVRGGKVIQLTHDQNYLSVLMEKVRDGEITEEEAKSHPKKEALVSYCGIKELKIKEVNLQPVKMMPGDVIILCSDGLYRLLAENEMIDILTKYNDDMNVAAYQMTTAVNNKNHRGQDNTSVILIKFN